MKLSRRPLSAMVCVLLPLAMSGCASYSYMGIGFALGSADPALQQLAQLARAGDKQAQLDLGKRFEVGDGVLEDKRLAVWLYRQAASDSGGVVWIYAPSPGGGAPAAVIPVDRGPRQAGLAEAKEKFDASRQGK
ncbi:MAG: hypothetical protein ACKOVA_01860 [Novosphingobium sp.]